MRPVQSRMTVVIGVLAVLLALVVARAVDLTIFQGPELARRSRGQYTTRVALNPHRGEIVDRHDEKLALSVDVPSIWVRPLEFAGQERAVASLARALHLDPATVRKSLANHKRFAWLKRQAQPREAEAVERLRLHGVYTDYEARRFYPYQTAAAQVLGFVGVDSRGLLGLERRYDKAVQGEREYLQAERDAHGHRIVVGDARTTPRGSRLELTLDLGIQTIAERELAAGVAAARAAGGTVVVLDPRTGEILALANAPTFDPNDPPDLPDPRKDPGPWKALRNRAVSDLYEPGSTLKAMLASAALEERVTSPGEMFFCENGRFGWAGRQFHDSHRHGWLSFADVIQVSSNIGAIKVGDRLGRERYHDYLRRFGFGQRTGIELPGEELGILPPPQSWARVDLATYSFGQGLAVTPLQMAAAFGAIANDGKLMQPHIVRRVVAPGGAVVEAHPPKLVRQVIRPETARSATQLLRRVVEEDKGTGTKARLVDFPVAGKTGTAQKINPSGRGYSSKRIGSFVGFVPADQPRLVILVLIDEPTGASYGGVVAAPVFRRIAEAALHEIGVEPASVDEPHVVPVAAVLAAPAPIPEPEPGVPAIPSFLGLSLREALRQARALGYAVRTSGAGYVVAQDPAAGTPRVGSPRLALSLEPARRAELP